MGRLRCKYLESYVMTHEFSNIELMAYDEDYQNAAETARIYIYCMFSNQFLPTPRCFVNVLQRGRVSSILRIQRGQVVGPDRPMIIVNAEEQILKLFLKNRSANTRSIDRQVGVSNKVVWRTLQEDLHHFQRVQDLKPKYYSLQNISVNEYYINIYKILILLKKQHHVINSFLLNVVYLI